jgi:hypothetical protein
MLDSHFYGYLGVLPRKEKDKFGQIEKSNLDRKSREFH